MLCAAILWLFVLIPSARAQLLLNDEAGIIENDFLQPGILTRNSIQKLTKRQAPPFQALTPNEPFLHPSWDPDHCDEKERIASAFLGTLELARYAMDSLRANGADDVFQRYFQASSRSSVFKIFRAFMNQQVGSQATVGPANVLFKNARMGYDDPPAGWSQENQGTCENRDDWAYMVNFKTKTSLANIGFLSVCPRAFTRLPVEVDLPLMTATSKDTRRCNDVMEKVYAWEEMRGLTGLLLHEFLHYNVLIASAAADFVGFINPQQSVYLGDFNSEDTQSGCDSPSVMGNVENYVWFAHEAYWSRLCHLDTALGPSVREEGTQPNFARMPVPPVVPGQGAPAACLLPANWNVVTGDEANDGFVP